MMATPHLLAGAALGRALRRPWMAYPAALASHLLLDTIPHLDSHGMFGIPGGRTTRPEAVAAVADFTVGALVVGALAWRQRNRTMALAALLAVVADLVEYVPPVGPWFRHWSLAAGWIALHHAIQHGLTPARWPLGMATQAAVVAAALGVVVGTGASLGLPTAGGNTNVGDPAGPSDEAVGDYRDGESEAAQRSRGTTPL